jgi:hypothetical protein
MVLELVLDIINLLKSWYDLLLHDFIGLELTIHVKRCLDELDRLRAIGRFDHLSDMLIKLPFSLLPNIFLKFFDENAFIDLTIGTLT